MSTPLCMSLVTICACEEPRLCSFTIISITWLSVIDDWDKAHKGVIIRRNRKQMIFFMLLISAVKGLASTPAAFASPRVVSAFDNGFFLWKYNQFLANLLQRYDYFF